MLKIKEKKRKYSFPNISSTCNKGNIIANMEDIERRAVKETICIEIW